MGLYKCYCCDIEFGDSSSLMHHINTIDHGSRKTKSNSLKRENMHFNKERNMELHCTTNGQVKSLHSLASNLFSKTYLENKEQISNRMINRIEDDFQNDDTVPNLMIFGNRNKGFNRKRNNEILRVTQKQTCVENRKDYSCNLPKRLYSKPAEKINGTCRCFQKQCFTLQSISFSPNYSD